MLIALRRLAVMATLVLVGPAAAGAADTGTIDVQLVTDPSPPGVSWTYSGAGPSFQLGVGTSKRSIADLQPGTYRIAETSAIVGAPSTLTAVSCSDPSHDSTADLAGRGATVALAAGETVTCTFTHRALGPRPAATAVQLARRFAPTLRFASAERYRPLAIQDYLSRTSLRAGSPPRGTSSATAPSIFALPTTSSPTYLDVRGAEPSSRASQYPVIEQQLEHARPRPTVYWRLAHEPSTGRVAIEYWFLYLYNDFTDQHEADWEGITVFLKDGSPIGITYTQHQGRSWSPWPPALSGGHAVDYVAAGSHANYPLPGRYRVRVCWTLAVRRCLVTDKRDDARGDGATLAPAGYDLHEFGGVPYTGGWGSGNYVLGVGLTRDKIADPRTRADYWNPFAGVPASA